MPDRPGFPDTHAGIKPHQNNNNKIPKDHNNKLNIHRSHYKTSFYSFSNGTKTFNTIFFSNRKKDFAAHSLQNSHYHDRILIITRKLFVSETDHAILDIMMSETLLISIIIPVYNVRPYLEESLSSAVNQTYQNLEILIIDDGSTDGSGSICDAYQQKDSRIRLFHQENRGLSAARNVGLDHMTGDLTAFLDPDDVFHPEMIRIMTESFLQYKTDIVTCESVSNKFTEQAIFPDYDYTKAPEIKLVSSTESLQLLIEKKLGIAVWNKLYVRSIWDDLRFPEGHVYEDIRTTYQLLEKADRILMLDQMLVFHRKRPGSITTTVSMDNFQDWYLAKDIYEQYVADHTPQVFKQEQKDHLLERNLRSASIMLCELNPVARQEHKNEIAETRMKILEGINSRKHKSNTIKSTVVFSIFKHCPALLPKIRKVYLFFKQLIEK